MKTVKADLLIELNVECPMCGHYFDLLQRPYVNDEGELLRDAITDKSWLVKAEERIECETECPKCATEIHVKGLKW